MKISVAQLQPRKGDIAANTEKHKALIALAVAHQSGAIFFPELSLTRYEPTLAQELAISKDDHRLDDFQIISDRHKITIALGVPTREDSGIKISMAIFQPASPRVFYSKQLLHSDEFTYFIPGDGQVILTLGNKKIAPAICYESLQPDHAENAFQMGAELYVACVAKSQKGIDKAMVHYPLITKKNAIPVLMSNCVGYCDNFESVGNSGVWTRQGILTAHLDDKSEGILTFDTESEEAVIQYL